jgi:hypothetical protein
MKDYKKCTICGEYHWTDSKCLPIYLVYHEEYMGDEPKEVRAVDHEEAAEEYGRYYNEDDYPLMNSDIEVKVVCPDGEEKWFTVSAEPDIHYSTNEIEK